jgi:hypothetical protein
MSGEICQYSLFPHTLGVSAEEEWGRGLIFLELLRIYRKENLFALAATQEFIGQLLSLLIQVRNNGRSLSEILCYDWLRCGHRFLPSYLQVQVELEEDQPLSVRKEHYRPAGSELAGVFDKENRNQLFNKSSWLPFSGQCLWDLSLSQVREQAVLIFLPEREESLYHLNKRWWLHVKNKQKLLVGTK